MSSVRLTNGTAPGTPVSGKTEVYVDTDKRLKTKDDAGLVRDLASQADVAAVRINDVFNIQVLRGNNAAYQVPTYSGNLATIYRSGQTAGQEMKLSITPAYSCYWEITWMLGTMQKTDAAYNLGEIQLLFNTAPVDPANTTAVAADYTTQHSTVQTFMSYSGTVLIELAASTAYTVTMKHFADGGTWQYYQGPQQLFMHAKAYRKA